MKEWALLRRSQAGDQRAGNELAARHFGWLTRFFQNKVQSELDAIDLVSETMRSCVEHKGEVPHSTVRAFVLQAAVEQLRNHHRRFHAWHQDSGLARLHTCDLDAERVRPPIAALGPEPRLLLEALRRISLDLQIVLELALFEGLDRERIAALLGRSARDVQSDLGYGRQRLSQAIEAAVEDATLARSTVDHLSRWATEIRREVLAGSL